MRKKKIMEQNALLFEKTGVLQREVSELKKQIANQEKLIAEKNEEIKALTEKAEEFKNLEKNLEITQAEITETTEIINTEKTEEDLQNTVFDIPKSSALKIDGKVEISELPEDMEYASKVIGKIVLSSAEHCNILTKNGETKYRELVNLILGKTEVAKADILSVVKTQLSMYAKVGKIDEICADAKEYFESVLAQR